jgi:hypothetical protein
MLSCEHASNNKPFIYASISSFTVDGLLVRGQDLYGIDLQQLHVKA